MKPALRALLALLAAAGIAAGPADAAGGLEIGMEDERLLFDHPERAADTVTAWAGAGVDVVRLHARWNEVAPGVRATRRPRAFSPADPGDPLYQWDELDRAIGAVRGAGLSLELTVTGPGPLWSSTRPGRRDPRYRPDPRAFRAFALAVARRYRGQVARYLLWNEPNIPGWLRPQFTCRRGRAGRVCTQASPHIYRGLVQAATPAIKAADPGAKVLFGELAPIGYVGRSELTIMAPLAFLRGLACVDGSLRPQRGGPCRRFRAVRGDAFGHHAHGVTSAPDARSADADWAKLGDLRRLERLLDRLTARRRLRPPGRRFDIHLTEFGYQTSPPDHALGIPVGRQAAWLQQAAYIAWVNPRVRSLTHYQWEDEPVRYRGRGRYAYAGWQSGLRYVDGEPKPALERFLTPFVVDRRKRGAGARVWGQVRPGGRWTVTLERAQGAAWAPIARLVTAGDGSFLRRLAVRGGDRLRFSWSGPPESAQAAGGASGTVRVAGASARLSAAR